MITGISPLADLRNRQVSSNSFISKVGMGDCISPCIELLQFLQAALVSLIMVLDLLDELKPKKPKITSNTAWIRIFIIKFSTSNHSFRQYVYNILAHI